MPRHIHRRERWASWLLTAALATFPALPSLWSASGASRASVGVPAALLDLSPSPTPHRPAPTPTAPPSPTPQPTPVPFKERAEAAENRADACSSEDCRRHEIEPIFREAWTADHDAEDHFAHKVISCESNWNRHAVGRADERSIFQLHPVHRKRVRRMGYEWEDMARIVPATKVAESIYREQGGSPWSCW